MDFTQRSAQSQPTQSTRNQPNAQLESDDVRPRSGQSASSKKSQPAFGGGLRVAAVVLLFSITGLLVAIAWLLYAGNDREVQYVDAGKFQAVQVDTDSSGSGTQVYYGHIKRLSDKYLVLQDVYYTVTDQSATATSTAKTSTTPTTTTPSTTTTPTAAATYLPVKLGCELRAPYDQLIINRDHVAFWENIRSDAGVGQKLATYEQQNPKAVACSTSSTPTLDSVAPVPSPSNTP